jgi:serine/threonine protein kinase
MGTFHKNALPIGHQVAEYTIEQVLGHGGFGITYLARDTSLGALVAIKEFLPGEIAQRDDNMRVLPNPDRQAVRDYQAGLKNFVKEAQALAHFKHPNIVRVLRFLEANGTAYTVMEYEEGQSLADYLKQHGPRLDEATILRVFIPILNGLHAVHEAKMLHLDIKPENIYLRRDGSPLLIDFGSARRAITETKHVQRIALTHGYAPIEQYPDKGAPGPWTDVYALGASMYRCISGKRPDDALSRYSAILKYQTDPLMSAAKIGGKHYQPMLLECIDWTMQIYAKDRPQSARELQDGLMGRRRQGGTAAPRSNPMNPLAPPRPATSPVTLGRSVRQNRFRHQLRTLLTAGRWLFTMAFIGAALIGVNFYWSEIRLWWTVLNGTAVSRPAAEHPAATADAAVQPPSSTTEAPTKAAATAAAIKAPVIPPPTVPDRTFSGHKDWVQSLAFSADGKWLASASVDRTIRVWDLSNGAVLGTLRGHEGTINAIVYSSDGKWLASASDDGSVRLWDAFGGGLRNTLRGQGGSMFAVGFSPNGKFLAAAGRDRTVFIWDMESGKRVATLEGHKGDVFALAFTPDGKTLATAGNDKTIRFWNYRSGEESSSLTGHKEAILSLAFSPDGRWLASGDAGQSLRIWDAQTLKHSRTINNFGHSALALAFSPDSRWLAVGTADRTVVLLEGDERVLAHTLSGHQDFVQTVALSPDGKLMASGSRDRNIRLWKTQ